MRTRRRFGQHFLESAWVEKVIAAIAPASDETFLEVGPGPGALTLPLAARVRDLVAVEIDRDLAAALSPRLPANVRLIVDDVLAVDLPALIPATARVVRVAGNLPYNVSSPVLERLFTLHEHDPRVTDATLMLQREVADRLTAAPGGREYSALTVTAGRYVRSRRLLELPPGAFRPPPEVRSTLVRLDFRMGAERVAAPPSFEAVVRAAFGQRRKRLSNALRALAETRGVPLPESFARARIDPGRRAETLSVEEFVRLAEALGEADD